MKKNKVGTWEIVQIDSWGKFTDFLNEKELYPKKWIFRGQTNNTWKIDSSICRIFKDINTIRYHAKKRRLSYKALVGRENEIVSIFKSKFHLYIQMNPELLIDRQSTHNLNKYLHAIMSEENKIEAVKRFEWLSIMQHYKAPTRLIDWTYSPYIALYFALENYSTIGCVYALNSHELNTYNEYLSSDNNFHFDIFTDDECNEPNIIAYDPVLKNERISRQQGLFLVSNTISESFEETLNSIVDQNGRNIGYKFNICPECIFDILNQLSYMGISSETVYPGLDGFSQTLKYEMLKNLYNIRPI